MGIEIKVNSLEEMCALMCDNVIPFYYPEEEAEEGEADNDKMVHNADGD